MDVVQPGDTSSHRALSGRTALMTGGSRGVGSACARALAELGADVVITYRAGSSAAAATVDELGQRGVQASALAALNHPLHLAPILAAGR